MRFTTLKRNNDFARAYKKGRSFVHPQMVLYVNKNRFKTTRVGITASKKTGNAVTRNRARRVLRSALCQVVPTGQLGPYDIVLVARGQTARLKSTHLAQTLKHLLQKAGLPVGGAVGGQGE